jgi:diaminopimelate decarboxylase
MKHVRLIGLDMHVGSQISQFQPYEIGLGRLLKLTSEIQRAGAKDLKYLDIGGGLAVTYDAEHPIDVEGFGAALKKMVKPTGLELILEPDVSSSATRRFCSLVCCIESEAGERSSSSSTLE